MDTTTTVTSEMIEAAKALLRAKKLTQKMKELSTAYENKILKEWDFRNEKTSERITDVKDIPTMGDKQFNLFVQMVDEEKSQAGLNLPPTKAPEKIVRKHEIECAITLFNLVLPVPHNVSLFDNVEMFEQIETNALGMVTDYCTMHKIELRVED